MWVSVIVKLATSKGAKLLIAMLVKKLLEHSDDGITKDIAEAMLDGIAQSRMNNAKIDVIEAVKKAL